MTTLPTLTGDGPVRILHLGDDENRFSPDWLDAIDACLDELEADPAPFGLVTVGDGRFYSNGLDLDWIGAHPDRLDRYVAQVQALFARMLTLPAPTVAAVNGHAFGAGAMFAMAHDHRVMRADRGYFCFPEVDIQIPFTPGMNALITSKLTPRAAIDAMTTGHRFGGPDALDAGLVDGVGDPDELIGLASARIAPHVGKHRGTLATIKQTLFAPVTDALAGGV